MRSKISFFNKGLFFSNLKRFSWACILETIVVFFCFPFNLMMTDTHYDWWEGYADILERSSQYTLLANLTLCVYPIVLAVLLFQYLHKIKMTTALHGLPVSRNVLFGSTVLSGIVLLLVPIVVNVLLVFVVKGTMEIGAWIVVKSVLRWMLYATALSLVLFAFASFVGMFVGNPAAQLVFTYILHFLPLAAYGGYAALGQMFLLGFSTEDGIPNWIMELPMMTILHEFAVPCGYYILLYFILAVVFFAFALLAYKKRPLEQAGDVVVFDWMKPVFKYGVSICFAVAGFLYIAGISNMDTQDNLIGNTLLAMVWAFVGFCIAQMLVAKTWRIFGARKEMFAVCVAIGVLFVLYQSDITGFEKRVPNPDVVASVRVDGLDHFPRNYTVFEEPENISIVTEMHRAIAENEAGRKLYGHYWRLEYTLKNGNKMYRTYYQAEDELFRRLRATQEAKQSGFYMFYDDVDDIESFIVPYGGEEYYIIEMDRLAEAIRTDVDGWDGRQSIYLSNTKEPKFDVRVDMKASEKIGYNSKYGRSYYFDVTPENMPNTFAMIDDYIQRATEYKKMLEATKQ